jgi:hypothetical protein
MRALVHLGFCVAQTVLPISRPVLQSDAQLSLGTFVFSNFWKKLTPTFSTKNVI